MSKSGVLTALVLVAAASAAVWAGGVTPSAQAPAGSAPGFQQGYATGCATGRAEGGSGTADFHQDERRYAVDVDYRQGWDAGERVCYNDQLRAPRILGGG